MHHLQPGQEGQRGCTLLAHNIIGTSNSAALMKGPVRIDLNQPALVFRAGAPLNPSTCMVITSLISLHGPQVPPPGRSARQGRRAYAHKAGRFQWNSRLPAPRCQLQQIREFGITGKPHVVWDRKSGCPGSGIDHQIRPPALGCGPLLNAISVIRPFQAVRMFTVCRGPGPYRKLGRFRISAPILVRCGYPRSCENVLVPSAW